MAIEVRSERPGDEAAIYRATEAAFKGRPYAEGDEQDLVNRLRKLGQLSLSLVAIDHEDLVGQVTFSPVKLSDGSQPWFALGPISVIPDRQGEGIGGQLIRAGLDEIDHMGALGCVLTGNPLYYQRFGFALATRNVPVEESAAFFQLKLIRAERAEGSFSFHPAFYEGEAPSAY